MEGSIGGKELNLEDTLSSELKAAALFNIILVRHNSEYFSFIGGAILFLTLSVSQTPLKNILSKCSLNKCAVVSQ